MFEGESGDTDIQRKHINNKGHFVITSGITENGILGKSDIEAKIFPKDTITIDMFGNAFFRPFEYKMVTHARVFALLPKFEMSINQGLFISSSLGFLKSKFGYENMCSWIRIKNETIKLPIKNGKIDFDFMEEFISELEEIKLERVKRYLKDNNLDNFELNKQEKEALEKFENDLVEWGEFRIGDLFEVMSSNKIFHANNLRIFDKRIEGSYPYVVRMISNNGVRGYIIENEKFLNKGNTLSFAQDTFSVFYQKKPYFTGNKVKVLKFKENFNERNIFFVVSSFQKLLKNYSWGIGSTTEQIKEFKIKLPTKNGKIDFDFMENLVKAIQKKIIKKLIKRYNLAGKSV